MVTKKQSLRRLTSRRRFGGLISQASALQIDGCFRSRDRVKAGIKWRKTKWGRARDYH